LGFDDGVEGVGNGLGGRAAQADLDAGRIAHGPAGELRELGRHGGAEEERLPLGGALLDDAFDVGQEAHVEHAVHLVEHEDLDVAQAGVALFEVIEEAAGRGDHDVDALVERLDLLAVADAAIDDGDALVGKLGVVAEGFLDLQRELAGGLEHEAAEAAVVAEALEHGECKGGGLAGAGLGGAHDIAAGQHDRDSLRLDRRGLGVALLLDGVGEGIGQAELGKRGVHLGHVGRRRSGCGLAALAGLGGVRGAIRVAVVAAVAATVAAGFAAGGIARAVGGALVGAAGVARGGLSWLAARAVTRRGTRRGRGV